MTMIEVVESPEEGLPRTLPDYDWKPVRILYIDRAKQKSVALATMYIPLGMDVALLEKVLCDAVGLQHCRR